MTNTPSNKTDIWQELRKPFPKGTVGKLPKPYSSTSAKDKCNECGGYHGLPAVHLDYVGHAAVTDRLNSVVGPDGWSWQPMATDEQGRPLLDADRNLWITLTIKDVSKPGVGDGNNMKERIGDALRNAAMRFGVALDLWTKEELESHLEDPSLKNDKPSQADDLPGLLNRVRRLMAEQEIKGQTATDYIQTAIGKSVPETVEDAKTLIEALEGER